MGTHLQALCINDNVTRLGNAVRINEKCLDLQKSKSSQRKKSAASPTSPSVGCLHLCVPSCRLLEDMASVTTIPAPFDYACEPKLVIMLQSCCTAAVSSALSTRSRATCPDQIEQARRPMTRSDLAQAVKAASRCPYLKGPEELLDGMEVDFSCHAMAVQLAFAHLVTFACRISCLLPSLPAPSAKLHILHAAVCW